MVREEKGTQQMMGNTGTVADIQRQQKRCGHQLKNMTIKQAKLQRRRHFNLLVAPNFTSYISIT